MLAVAKVNRIVREVASAILKNGAGVQRVDSEPTVDGDGQEALHITIVLQKGSAAKMSGDSALDTLVELKRRYERRKRGGFQLSVM